MRKQQQAILVAFSVGLMVACSLLAPGAEAQTASQGTRAAQTTTGEPFAQPVRVEGSGKRADRPLRSRAIGQ